MVYQVFFMNLAIDSEEVGIQTTHWIPTKQLVIKGI